MVAANCGNFTSLAMSNVDRPEPLDSSTDRDSVAEDVTKDGSILSRSCSEIGKKKISDEILEGRKTEK